MSTQGTTAQTDEALRAAAVDAAMTVFDRTLKLVAPNRVFVEEALDAAGQVYAAAAEAELDRLMGEAKLAGMQIDGHDVAIRFKQAHDVLRGAVAAFDALFIAHAGAANYVEHDYAVGGPPANVPGWVEQETTFTDPDAVPLRRYRVIVVKPGGKSPHELRQEFEQRAVLAEARIAAALALVEGGMPVGPRNLRVALTGVSCTCELLVDEEPDWDPECPQHGTAPIEPAVMAELLGHAREATHWAMGSWVDVIGRAPGERTHYDGMLANVIRAVLDRVDEPATGSGTGQ